MEEYPFLRQLRPPLTEKQLRPLDTRCRVVQFCDPLTDLEMDRLAAFMSGYPHVPLRVYGHNTVDNLDFLKKFPFLQGLQVDAWHLRDFSGIRNVGPQLEYLGLGATKSKSISMSLLRQFPGLKDLYLEGHRKDIEIVSELPRLEILSLRSITVDGLDFLKPVKSLRWLDLKLGGTRNLDALSGMTQLEYLELWFIRGLCDLTPVSSLENLQVLHLETLKNVSVPPEMGRLRNLQRLHLQNLANLTTISQAMLAPALRELLLIDLPLIRQDELIALKDHPTLEKILVATGGLKKNTQIRRVLGEKAATGLDDFPRFKLGDH